MRKLEECNEKRRGMEEGEKMGERRVRYLLSPYFLDRKENYGQWKPVHNDSGVEFLS